jgi:hypothetical protein
MPFDPNILKGLTLRASDIPPEMLEQDSQSKYNDLLKKYEGMYNNNTVPQDNVLEATARREDMSTPAALFDLGQGIASAVNQYAGGKGFDATAGNVIRNKAQRDIDEAKLANKEALERKIQQMKGAENLLGLYQKDMSDKEKRALDKEQKEINREYLKVQQQQEKRSGLRDAREAIKQQEEIKNIQEDHNPMSAKSQLLQEYITQKFPEYGEMVKGKAYAELNELSKRMLDKSQLSEYQQMQMSMKQDDKINTQVEKLSKRLTDPKDDVIGQTQMLENLDNTMKTLGVSFDSLNGKDLPGFGRTGVLPNIATSQSGVNFRQDVSGLANALLKSRSGAAVTSQEEKRFLEEMGTGKTTFSDINVLRGLKKIKEIMERRAKTIEAYPDEVKTTLKERTGLELPSEVLSRIGSPKAVSGEVERITKDGQTAIFDAKTKQFLRYK